jgi:hypothetical protein
MKRLVFTIVLSAFTSLYIFAQDNAFKSSSSKKSGEVSGQRTLSQPKEAIFDKKESDRKDRKDKSDLQPATNSLNRKSK